MAEAARLRCFKAYDIRGRIPDDLNADLVTKIGRAFATFLKPRRVAVGHDIRLSSPDMARALTRGLTESGVDVVDVGIGGTEMVYFATFHLGLDGGAMVTASHNPADYNGVKLVREEARPISADTGLMDIEAIVREERFDAPASKPGRVESVDIYPDYVRHLLSYVDPSSLKPLRTVVNPGNGGAGLVLRRLEASLPVQLIKIHDEPDGTFPNGIPNPLLPENRHATAEAVRREGADLGVAWDGDFDRCFFFDERGAFIEGYYVVGLLAERVLDRHPGAKIVHDPRLVWNTVEVVRRKGGVPVQSKSGHAFMKEVMRLEDAWYGGEMSAHHYFKEFSYCDSGMIPMLLVLDILSRSGRKLSELVGEAMERYPASGEINRRIPDPQAALDLVRETYGPQALKVDTTDGISMEFETWRFNLRPSNTEPLVRLNVESRGDRKLMEDKTREILDLLDRLVAKEDAEASH